MPMIGNQFVDDATYQQLIEETSQAGANSQQWSFSNTVIPQVLGIRTSAGQGYTQTEWDRERSFVAGQYMHGMAHGAAYLGASAGVMYGMFGTPMQNMRNAFGQQTMKLGTVNSAKSWGDWFHGKGMNFTTRTAEWSAAEGSGLGARAAFYTGHGLSRAYSAVRGGFEYTGRALGAGTGEVLGRATGATLGKGFELGGSAMKSVYNKFAPMEAQIGEQAAFRAGSALETYGAGIQETGAGFRTAERAVFDSTRATIAAEAEKAGVKLTAEQLERKTIISMLKAPKVEGVSRIAQVGEALSMEGKASSLMARGTEAAGRAVGWAGKLMKSPWRVAAAELGAAGAVAGGAIGAMALPLAAEAYVMTKAIDMVEGTYTMYKNEADIDKDLKEKSDRMLRPGAGADESMGLAGGMTAGQRSRMQTMFRTMGETSAAKTGIGGSKWDFLGSGMSSFNNRVGDLKAMFGQASDMGMLDNAGSMDEIERRFKAIVTQVDKLSGTLKKSKAEIMTRLKELQDQGFDEMQMAGGHLGRQFKMSKITGYTEEAVAKVSQSGSQIFESMGLSGAAGGEAAVRLLPGIQNAINRGVVDKTRLRMAGGAEAVALNAVATQARVMNDISAMADLSVMQGRADQGGPSIEEQISAMENTNWTQQNLDKMQESRLLVMNQEGELVGANKDRADLALANLTPDQQERMFKIKMRQKVAYAMRDNRRGQTEDQLMEQILRQQGMSGAAAKVVASSMSRSGEIQTGRLDALATNDAVRNEYAESQTTANQLSMAWNNVKGFMFGGISGEGSSDTASNAVNSYMAYSDDPKERQKLKRQIMRKHGEFSDGFVRGLTNQAGLTSDGRRNVEDLRREEKEAKADIGLTKMEKAAGMVVAKAEEVKTAFTRGMIEGEGADIGIAGQDIQRVMQTTDWYEEKGLLAKTDWKGSRINDIASQFIAPPGPNASEDEKRMYNKMFEFKDGTVNKEMQKAYELAGRAARGEKITITDANMARTVGSLINANAKKLLEREGPAAEASVRKQIEDVKGNLQFNVGGQSYSMTEADYIDANAAKFTGMSAEEADRKRNYAGNIESGMSAWARGTSGTSEAGRDLARYLQLSRDNDDATTKRLTQNFSAELATLGNSSLKSMINKFDSNTVTDEALDKFVVSEEFSTMMGSVNKNTAEGGVTSQEITRKMKRARSILSNPDTSAEDKKKARADLRALGAVSRTVYQYRGEVAGASGVASYAALSKAANDPANREMKESVDKLRDFMSSSDFATNDEKLKNVLTTFSGKTIAGEGKLGESLRIAGDLMNEKTAGTVDLASTIAALSDDKKTRSDKLMQAVRQLGGSVKGDMSDDDLKTEINRLSKSGTVDKEKLSKLQADTAREIVKQGSINVGDTQGTAAGSSQSAGSSESDRKLSELDKKISEAGAGSERAAYLLSRAAVLIDKLYDGVQWKAGK